MNVSETTMRYSYISLISVLLAIFFILPDACLADKGGWHLSTKPVTLTESGQRAIIGWSGETEILCLSTDVSSSEETTVIEFLPLPSEPNVTLGSKDTFEAVEKLLAKRGVKLTMPAAGGTGPPREGESEPFRITFHERLGAHDVTVVKVNRPDEFADWVQEKAKALTGGRISLPNSIRKLITKYLNEYNCPYFVFDVIEVGSNPQSVEPIIYEFKSPVMFYPLEISSTFHGQTTIDLILFSRCAIDQSPFDDRAFLLSNIVQVDAAEMQEVFPRLNQLLGKSAYVQAFKYTGTINRLRGNITAGPTTEHIGISRERYARGIRRSFRSGIIAGMLGSVLIAFICLWPMYFTAKRQKPRWGLRLLAGLLLGMPLGFALASFVLHVKGYESTKELNYAMTVSFLGVHMFVEITPLMICYIFSMVMGFIIFCFQLGLRRRWYIWWLVYAALAIPVVYIGFPIKLMDLNRYVLVVNMGPWFVMHMAVFVALFLIAKFVVWVTSPQKSPRGSLSG